MRHFLFSWVLALTAISLTGCEDIKTSIQQVMYEEKNRFFEEAEDAARAAAKQSKDNLRNELSSSDEEEEGDFSKDEK